MHCEKWDYAIISQRYQIIGCKKCDIILSFCRCMLSFLQTSNNGLLEEGPCYHLVERSNNSVKGVGLRCHFADTSNNRLIEVGHATILQRYQTIGSKKMDCAVIL